MNLKKLSVKNFIGDLPRIINESLDAIQTAFTNIYDDETNTLGNNTVTLTCDKVTTHNIVVTGDGDVKILTAGKTVSLTELFNSVEELKDEIETLKQQEDGINQTSRLVKKKLQ